MKVQYYTAVLWRNGRKTYIEGILRPDAAIAEAKRFRRRMRRLDMSKVDSHTVEIEREKL